MLLSTDKCSEYINRLVVSLKIVTIVIHKSLAKLV